MILRIAVALVVSAVFAASALAAPARIIILRHGEKDNPWTLCGVGEERAKALVSHYLGRDAGNSLFAPGEKPAAVLAITLHTMELATPAAASWDLPLTAFAVLPGMGADLSEAALNTRTQEAAAALMKTPEWQGKTVVVVWEHKHIANAKLAAANPGEAVTFRQLLQLDTLKGVPETWPSGNYDYFWIVDYADGASKPTGFHMVKQDFGKHADVPENDWGTRNGLTADTKCNLKGAD